MAKRIIRKFKDTNEMLIFLREMGKRNEQASKKNAELLKEEEKKYKKELAAYEALYGKYKND
jgi:hypothetical protein